MNRLAKIEWVRRKLLLGWVLDDDAARKHIRYKRLADGIFVLRGKGWIIENLNPKPKFARYKLINIDEIKAKIK